MESSETLPMRSQAALRRAGVAPVRAHRRPGVDPHEPSPTCQIPALANLYRLHFRDPSPEHVVGKVGAFDGYTYSNAWQLAELGRRIFVFEPVPAHAEMCRRRYRGKENVRVQPVTVGSTPGRVTTPVGGGYSTADAGTADTYEGIAYASTKLTKTTITAPSTISSRHCSTLPRASTCWWSTSRATRPTSRRVRHRTMANNDGHPPSPRTLTRRFRAPRHADSGRGTCRPKPLRRVSSNAS